MLISIVVFAVLECAYAQLECIGGYAPAAVAIRRLNGMENPLSWHDIDWQCTVQFPGYEMLKRDFTRLSRAERELCGDETVPLGLQKYRGTGAPFWRGAFGIELVNGLVDEDDISSTYLKYKKPTIEPEDHKIEWRGALSLLRNEWWLVPVETTFRCALCQRARRSNLDIFPARRTRSEPFKYAYTAEIRNIFFGQMTVPYFVNYVQEVFDKANVSIVVVKSSTSSLVGARKYSMRMRSAKQLVQDDVQSLLAGFEVSSWTDMDYCPAFKSSSLNSDAAKIGSVASAQLPGKSHWVSRDCVAKVLEEGDYDAVWDKLIEWTTLKKKCPTVREERQATGSTSYMNRVKRLDDVKYNLTAQQL